MWKHNVVVLLPSNFQDALEDAIFLHELEKIEQLLSEGVDANYRNKVIVAIA